MTIEVVKVEDGCPAFIETKTRQFTSWLNNAVFIKVLHGTEGALLEIREVCLLDLIERLERIG